MHACLYNNILIDVPNVLAFGFPGVFIEKRMYMTPQNVKGRHAKLLLKCEIHKFRKASLKI